MYVFSSNTRSYWRCTSLKQFKIYYFVLAGFWEAFLYIVFGPLLKRNMIKSLLVLGCLCYVLTWKNSRAVQPLCWMLQQKKWLHAEWHCYVTRRYKTEQLIFIHMKILLTYNIMLYMTVNLKAPDITGRTNTNTDTDIWEAHSSPHLNIFPPPPPPPLHPPLLLASCISREEVTCCRPALCHLADFLSSLPQERVDLRGMQLENHPHGPPFHPHPHQHTWKGTVKEKERKKDTCTQGHKKYKEYCGIDIRVENTAGKSEGNWKTYKNK